MQLWQQAEVVHRGENEELFVTQRSSAEVQAAHDCACKQENLELTHTWIYSVLLQNESQMQGCLI